MGSAAKRARRFASLVVALLALAGLVAAAVQAFRGPSGDLVALGEETVLRLHDLPPGYRVGDDSGCGPWDPEGSSDALVQFVVENWPEGCTYQYEQLFQLPHADSAPLVEAETSNFPSVAAARKGFGLLTGGPGGRRGSDVSEVIPAPAIGERARLFHSDDVNVIGNSRRRGSYLVWQEGTLVSALLVAGRRQATNDRIILRLAQVQQARIEAPTPYTEAERDDSTVALDDPTLRYPVYWLGPTFAPGRGLPAANLEEAFTMSAPGEGPPGEKATLWYGGFDLDLWTQKGWKSFQRSALGPLNRKRKCTTSRRVELDHGHAEVFAGYGKLLRHCPKRPPNRFYAIARIDGMVIGVNLIHCTGLGCLAPGSGPYNSLKGMKAIVRGLKLRPKPVY